MVVIGAGPVGLAAAAHLAERGVDFVVLESGPGVAAAIEEWRHVKLFSPWRYDIDSAARRLLEPAGWVEPDLGTLPTGGDLIDSYLEPLTKTPQLNDRIRYGAEPSSRSPGSDSTGSVLRAASDAPFLIRLADGTECSPLPSSTPPAPGAARTSSVAPASLPAAETAVSDGIARALPDVLGP